MAEKPRYRALASIDPQELAQFQAGIRKRYTDDQIVAEIIACAERLGRSPTMREFAADPETAVHPQTVIEHFGSWNAAKRAAGLVPRRFATREELLGLLRTLGDELAATGVNGNGTVVHVALQGTPRDLHPILRDDIYRIAGEALRNVFRHAQAPRIEVEITYDDRQFRLQVRDDGKGTGPAVLANQQHGHFGLPGMRERAELVGGRLGVWSDVGVGTEIDLTIPAARAYAAARARRRAW